MKLFVNVCFSFVYFAYVLIPLMHSLHSVTRSLF